jgi:hypothetical protein
MKVYSGKKIISRRRAKREEGKRAEELRRFQEKTDYTVQCRRIC